MEALQVVTLLLGSCYQHVCLNMGKQHMCSIQSALSYPTDSPDQLPDPKPFPTTSYFLFHTKCSCFLSLLNRVFLILKYFGLLTNVLNQGNTCNIQTMLPPFPSCESIAYRKDSVLFSNFPSQTN